SGTPQVQVSGPAQAFAGDVERINLLNNASTFAVPTTYTVNDMTGTSVRTVGVSFRQNGNNSTSSSSAFSAIVFGTQGADAMVADGTNLTTSWGNVALPDFF